MKHPKKCPRPFFGKSFLCHPFVSEWFKLGVVISWSLISDVAGWFVLGLQITNGSCNKLPISQPFVYNHKDGIDHLRMKYSDVPPKDTKSNNISNISGVRVFRTWIVSLLFRNIRCFVLTLCFNMKILVSYFFGLGIYESTPRKLTWNRNMEVWKMLFLFQMWFSASKCQISGQYRLDVCHIVDGSEILHLLGCIKPYECWNKLPTSTDFWAEFLNHQRTYRMHCKHRMICTALLEVVTRLWWHHLPWNPHSNSSIRQNVQQGPEPRRRRKSMYLGETTRICSQLSIWTDGWWFRNPAITSWYGCFQNRGTPKSSILIGFSLINHPFWDIPLFLETLIW